MRSFKSVIELINTLLSSSQDVDDIRQNTPPDERDVEISENAQNKENAPARRSSASDNAPEITPKSRSKTAGRGS